MKYFYYQRGPLGNWMPRTTEARPSEKTAEGKIKVRQIVELPEADREQPLKMLERLYPLVDDPT